MWFFKFEEMVVYKVQIFFCYFKVIPVLVFSYFSGR